MTCDSMDSRPIRAEPAHLAVHFLAHLRRQLELVELLLQLVHLTRLFVLAQLLADLLELLAEKHLALPLAQLLLDLGFDVFLRVQQVDLPLHVHQYPPEPLLHRQGLEQRLALRRGYVDVPGHQIGKLARLVDAREHLLHDVVGQARLLAELGSAESRPPGEGRETPDHPGSAATSPRPHARSPGGSHPSRSSGWRCRGSRRAGEAERPTIRAASGRCGRRCRPCRAPRESTLSMFWRCDTANTSRSGVVRAASMARRVAGRPAPIGAVTPGNNTTSRRGRTGRVMRSLIGCLSSLLALDLEMLGIRPTRMSDCRRVRPHKSTHRAN